jgi:hypothetical protein
VLDGAEALVIRLDPELLRDVRDLESVLKFLADELDWPVDLDQLEESYFDWDPEELGIPVERVPSVVSLRQLRPLTAEQPWGLFFMEFSGPRLPLMTLRRLLQSLVTKKRQTGDGSRRTWDLDDLLFIITTNSGSSVELHFIAFFDEPGHAAEVRSLAWRPDQSPAQHLHRLARELLPHLAWPDDEVVVPDHWRRAWRNAFKLRHGEAIASATRLAERMADTAFALRAEIGDALAAEGADGPFRTLMGEVREQLVGDVTPARFADMCAQTLVYGVLTGRVTDPDAFGASPTLSSVPLSNPFLTAFFEDVHDQAADLDLEDVGLEQLVADLRKTNVEAILDQFGSGARGGDPVIHFYEEFLRRYDPRGRVDAGAFYTPQPVVKFMTRMVDVVLKSRFGLDDGIADDASWGEVAEQLNLKVPADREPSAQFVSMIDPATGTGTFLVEWLRQARASFTTRHPESDWPEYVQEHVLPNLHALELMLAPYAVAHLKTALELHAEGVTGAELGIYLTDTLESGHSGQLTMVADPLSVEGERAEEVKRHTPATICIGNPPYDRVARDAGGGWITDRSGGRSPFDDILDPALEHTIFSHHASLYNKFVYFWRWALWKVFEQRPESPGVVSFITPSSWLTGPGFLGLRQLIRQIADDIWIVDLAGDNRGMRRDENVFDIETPVAIVIVSRSTAADQNTSARAHYRRAAWDGGRETARARPVSDGPRQPFVAGGAARMACRIGPWFGRCRLGVLSVAHRSLPMATAGVQVRAHVADRPCVRDPRGPVGKARLIG